MTYFAPARPRRAPEGLSRLTAPNPSAPGVARAPRPNARTVRAFVFHQQSKDE